MKLASRVLLVAAVIAATFSFCDAAGAANVVLGPSLTGTWASEECEAPICLNSNYELGAAGTAVTSPVTGAVVGFNVVGGETAGTYRLRTLIPAQATAGVALFRKASAPVAVVPTAGVQHYSTVLSIRAGEAIGLSQSEGASVGFLESAAGATFGEWATEPAENTSSAGFGGPGLVGYNAEVQPAPTITSLGATSGPTAGGTAVTITGTDLENASAVSFGGTSAASFSADSETQLTAVAPANAAAVAVSVTVTTVAGKATSPQNFTYVAPAPAPVVTKVAQCVVPKLKGKKLKAAKKALVTAKCKVGTVKKLKGASARTGKVAGQSRKPNSKLPAGTKVNLTLKP